MDFSLKISIFGGNLRELILACALTHEKCIFAASSYDDTQSLLAAGDGQFCGALKVTGSLSPAQVKSGPWQAPCSP